MIVKQNKRTTAKTDCQAIHGIAYRQMYLVHVLGAQVQPLRTQWLLRTLQSTVVNS